MTQANLEVFCLTNAICLGIPSLGQDATLCSSSFLDVLHEHSLLIVMAWEATDKALARALNALPQRITQVFFLLFVYKVFTTLFRNSQTIPIAPAPAQTTTVESKQNHNNEHFPRTPILNASEHINDKKHHLLLASTGSVATIKLPNIIQALSKHKNLSIRIILTKSATEFLQGQASEQPTLASISKLPNVDGVYLDEDEWRKPWVRGDSILHIELRRWADLMVIAPLSANALAKVALGLSDSLVYSVVRAWDTTGLIDEGRPGISLPYAGVDLNGEAIRKKGIIMAPAMNTAMWNHPVTKKHLDVLEGEWSVANGGWMEVLRPIDKGLACGDKGGGGMREWKEIVEVVEDRLELNVTEGDEYVAVDTK